MFEKVQHMWNHTLGFADLCISSISFKKLLNGHSILHKTLTASKTLLQLSYDVSFKNMQSYKTTSRPILLKLFYKCLIS